MDTQKQKTSKLNPVRNSSPAIAGLETERGIISKGVNRTIKNLQSENNLREENK